MINKIYFLVLVLISNSLKAQISPTGIKELISKDKFEILETRSQINQIISKSQSEFWFDDFSNSSTWVIGNNEALTSQGVNDNWTIGTSGGSGTYGLVALNSSTASNGFALFDSDMYCSGSQSAYIKVANAIDCSLQPSVMLHFQQYYRKYNTDACFVSVSTDGVVWTDIQINEELSSRMSTVNGAGIMMDISAYAAGQATVYIRFLYVSSGTYPYYGCDYNWMVDDVKLTPVPNYDLTIKGLDWGTTGSWSTPLAYYQVPDEQVSSVDIGGVVQNNGLLNQSNVMVTATSGTYSSSGISTLATQQIDTIFVNNPFIPSTVPGSVTIDVSVSSPEVDDNPADNIYMPISFEVTDNIYARDAGVPSSIIGNQGNSFVVGNIFDIFTDQTLYSVDVHINDNTEVGTTVRAILYEIQDEFWEILYSEDHVITSEELGTTINLFFSDPMLLYAGTSYLVAVATDGGSSTGLVVSTSGTSKPQTSYYKDEFESWYYTLATPMVRMNFKEICFPSLSITTANNLTCTGSTVVFQSNALDGGDSPSYEWFVNGGSVGTGGTYTTNSLANNDVVSCVLTSNALCASASTSTVNSNAITMMFYATPAMATITQTVYSDSVILTSSSASGNQWYFNGVAINDANSQTFSAVQNGNYTVIVFANNCFSDVSNVSVVSGLSVGVNDLEMNETMFVTYPNPNEGIFIVAVNSVEASRYNVKLHNAVGQLIYEDELDNFVGFYSKEMNIIENGTGVYFLSISNGTKEKVKKIVVY